jgi:hypothetical protein
MRPRPVALFVLVALLGLACASAPPPSVNPTVSLLESYRSTLLQIDAARLEILRVAGDANEGRVIDDKTLADIKSAAVKVRLALEAARDGVALYVASGAGGNSRASIEGLMVAVHQAMQTLTRVAEVSNG